MVMFLLTLPLFLGYGFIDFEKHDDAMVAVRALQGKGVLAQRKYAHQCIYTPFLFLQHHDKDCTNLYITNLPKEYNEEVRKRCIGEGGIGGRQREKGQVTQLLIGA